MRAPRSVNFLVVIDKQLLQALAADIAALPSWFELAIKFHGKDHGST